MIFSVFQKMLFFGYSWSTLLWYRCYYPHRSRDALSPVCGIFTWLEDKHCTWTVRLVHHGTSHCNVTNRLRSLVYNKGISCSGGAVAVTWGRIVLNHGDNVLLTMRSVPVEATRTVYRHDVLSRWRSVHEWWIVVSTDECHFVCGLTF